MKTNLKFSSLGASDSDSGNLFSTPILPEQYYEIYRGDRFQRADNAEKKLLSAILLDGVKSFIRAASETFGKSTQSFEQSCALSWVYSHEREYVFSFENVCENLGINPDYLRDGLETILAFENETSSNCENPLSGEVLKKEAAGQRIRNFRRRGPL